MGNINKKDIKFFLAGSCLKVHTFRDLDMYFPINEDRELMNSAINHDYFEYEDNSYMYSYKNASLAELVDGFDFDSTKTAFECNCNTKKRLFSIIKCGIRIEFVNYINTHTTTFQKSV